MGCFPQVWDSVTRPWWAMNGVRSLGWEEAKRPCRRWPWCRVSSCSHATNINCHTSSPLATLSRQRQMGPSPKRNSIPINAPSTTKRNQGGGKRPWSNDERKISQKYSSPNQSLKKVLKLVMKMMNTWRWLLSQHDDQRNGEDDVQIFSLREHKIGPVAHRWHFSPPVLKICTVKVKYIKFKFREIH